MLGQRVLVGCLLLTALVSAGCGVPRDGHVGIGRDADGTLRVHVRTCHEAMDGATLYWPDDPQGFPDGEVFAEWEIRSQPDSLRADWPLLGPAIGNVVATRPLSAVPGQPKNMAIYAWTNDNTFSADGPYLFTEADLGKLRPGQVLVANDTGAESDPPNKTTTLAAFDAIDCMDFG